MIELSGCYLQVSAVALTGTCLQQFGWDIGREASIQILISYHVKGVRQCSRSLPELKNLIYQILHCSDGPVFTGCSRMSSSASKCDSNRFKVWQTVCSCAPGRDSTQPSRPSVLKTAAKRLFLLPSLLWLCPARF